jgi:hypothetical protein
MKYFSAVLELRSVVAEAIGNGWRRIGLTTLGRKRIGAGR